MPLFAWQDPDLSPDAIARAEGLDQCFSTGEEGLTLLPGYTWQ